MPGLVPGTQVLSLSTETQTWMAGTSPAMTDDSIGERSRSSQRQGQAEPPPLGIAPGGRSVSSRVNAGGLLAAGRPMGRFGGAGAGVAPGAGVDFAAGGGVVLVTLGRLRAGAGAAGAAAGSTGSAT